MSPLLRLNTFIEFHKAEEHVKHLVAVDQREKEEAARKADRRLHFEYDADGNLVPNEFQTGGIDQLLSSRSED